VPVELRDDDLLLRPPVADDVDAIAVACSDEEMARFLPILPSPYGHSDAEWWVARCEQVWLDGDACPFVIVDASCGELLGAIEIRPGDRTIGYWVAAPARGRGVATRALELVCNWYLERPLSLMTHPDNVASQRVAEKAGFRRVGTREHRPAFRDGVTEAAVFQLD
jgi:RimJ/RimL family protein N-acetyltransferase